LRWAPPLLAPSPFPLGNLLNPLMPRVTSLGPGTRCFIFSAPPLSLGELRGTWGGETPGPGPSSLAFCPPLLLAILFSLSPFGVSVFYLPGQASPLPQVQCAKACPCPSLSSLPINVQLSLPLLLPPSSPFPLSSASLSFPFHPGAGGVRRWARAAAPQPAWVAIWSTTGNPGLLESGCGGVPGSEPSSVHLASEQRKSENPRPGAWPPLWP
jgi:hypothetical protein